MFSIGCIMLLALVICCDIVCLFFFFKQKTAYELRISDWSSDVCSSDLEAITGQRADHGGALRDLARLDVAQRTAQRCGRRRLAEHAFIRGQQQIGRASCRERVWQYV